MQIKVVIKLNLLKVELYKLYKDKQFRFIVAIIIAYLFYNLFVVEPPTNQSLEGWIVSGTTDSILMIFFIGIVSAVVSTIDYDNRTYKNFLPYVDIKKMLISKFFIILIGIFALLLLWYGIVIICSIIFSGNLDNDIISPVVERFIFQYFLIVFHSSFIILAGIISRNRAVASSFTVIGWIMYSFIPVKDEYLYDLIVENYQWKKGLNVSLCFAFILVYVCASLVAMAIAERQEVLV